MFRKVREGWEIRKAELACPQGPPVTAPEASSKALRVTVLRKSVSTLKLSSASDSEFPVRIFFLIPWGQ